MSEYKHLSEIIQSDDDSNFNDENIFRNNSQSIGDLHRLENLEMWNENDWQNFQILLNQSCSSIENIDSLENQIQSNLPNDSEYWDLNDWYTFAELFNEFENNNESENMNGGRNQLYEIISSNEKSIGKFGLQRKTLEIITKDPQIDNFIDANELCREFIEQIFNDLINSIHDSHPKIGL